VVLLALDDFAREDDTFEVENVEFVIFQFPGRVGGDQVSLLPDEVAKARKGHATGPAPYGYRTVRLGEHSEYQVNDEQAAVVRQAFQWSAEGLGDHRVRNRLAELTGRPWTKTSVGRLLGNPVYTGHLVFGRTKTAPRGGKAKRRERLAEPAVIIEKPDLRIIDQPLWQRVQARKATTRAHYAAGADHVCVQVLGGGTPVPVAQWRAISKEVLAA